MTGPKYATSKVRLARALNLSRETIHRLSQEIDFPRETSHGWHLATVRKWMARHQVNLNGSEKEELQTALLRKRLEREDYALSKEKNGDRSEIYDEAAAVISSGMWMLRGKMTRLMTELAPCFEGMRAIEILKLWRERQEQIFSEIKGAFEEKLEKEITIPDENVLPFESGGANENGTNAT
jgi:hypothetical protein